MKSAAKMMWAGFLNGKIDLSPKYIPGKGPGASRLYGVLYRIKDSALNHYQDVRRVEVKEVK